MRAWVVGATHESFPLFRCPSCSKVGDIDDDQFRGRVSIVCGNCGYHETVNWEAQCRHGCPEDRKGEGRCSSDGRAATS